MKKIKKILKKLNNQGSSVVMVVAALGFIGIIVGALLMAAGYTYKQKLQDLNARDNFYYVEQAMNEIYAGVGSIPLKIWCILICRQEHTKTEQTKKQTACLKKNLWSF